MNSQFADGAGCKGRDRLPFNVARPLPAKDAALAQGPRLYGMPPSRHRPNVLKMTSASESVVARFGSLCCNVARPLCPSWWDMFKTKIVSMMMAVNNKPKHVTTEYRTALGISAMLNLAMLFIEGGVGLWVGSAALVADAADFLEDATVLGLACAAIGRSARARAIAGLVQGLAMAGVGVVAAIQIVLRILEGGAPWSASMGGVAGLALTVNAYCVYRLIRFRGGDASMRAIWLSLRNDAMLNVLTIIAAILIAITASGWPDIVAGAIIASVNLWASIEVMWAATREMRTRNSD